VPAAMCPQSAKKKWHLFKLNVIQNNQVWGKMSIDMLKIRLDQLSFIDMDV
jgi:hypothetical protein